MKMRRLRPRRKSNHADDWLMTYADMITLLLCFFVLFLVITIAQKKAATGPEPQPPVEIAKVEPPPPEPEIPVRVTVEEPPPLVVQPKEEEVLPKPEVAEPSPPEIVTEPKAQGSAAFEQKGDRITSIEMNSAAFFESGSAIISDAGKKILLDLIPNLKKATSEGYQVTIEGHTDDTPIKTTLFPSNWELSTARAAAVVRYFLEEGIPAEKLRAAGYADTFPKLPNRDQKGDPLPANQAQNRRVVLRLDKIEKAGETP